MDVRAFLKLFIKIIYLVKLSWLFLSISPGSWRLENCILLVFLFGRTWTTKTGLVSWNSDDAVALKHLGRGSQCLSERVLVTESSSAARSNNFMKHISCLRWNLNLCWEFIPGLRLWEKIFLMLCIGWWLRKFFSTRSADILGGLSFLTEVAPWCTAVLIIYSCLKWLHILAG